jgi:hypothetical protein
MIMMSATNSSSIVLGLGNNGIILLCLNSFVNVASALKM